MIPWGRQENLPKIKSLSGSVKDYLKYKVLFIPLFSFVIVLQSISIYLPYSLFFWFDSCLDLFEFDLVHTHIYINMKKKKENILKKEAWKKLKKAPMKEKFWSSAGH